MRTLAARLIGAGAGLWLADFVLKGVTLNGWLALGVGAVVLALARAVVRPILGFMTFPITLLTLGASLWAINAAILVGTAWIVEGVQVDGVVPALFGALIVSVIAQIADSWAEGAPGSHDG